MKRILFLTLTLVGLSTTWSLQAKDQTDENALTLNKSVWEANIKDEVILKLNSNAIDNVTWFSKDDSVATVTQGGIVKATGVGNTKIIATLTNHPNIQVTCEVNIK